MLRLDEDVQRALERDDLVGVAEGRGGVAGDPVLDEPVEQVRAGEQAELAKEVEPVRSAGGVPALTRCEQTSRSGSYRSIAARGTWRRARPRRGGRATASARRRRGARARIGPPSACAYCSATRAGMNGSGSPQTISAGASIRPRPAPAAASVAGLDAAMQLEDRALGPEVELRVHLAQLALGDRLDVRVAQREPHHAQADRAHHELADAVEAPEPRRAVPRRSRRRAAAR